MLTGTRSASGRLAKSEIARTSVVDRLIAAGLVTVSVPLIWLRRPRLAALLSATPTPTARMWLPWDLTAFASTTAALSAVAVGTLVANGAEVPVAVGSPSVTKTTSGATSFFYDGANAAQELVGGSPTATTLTGGVDEVFQRTEGASTRAVLTDALGSTVALVDGAGAVQTQYTYEPFGATTASGAASANPAQFTGRENDGTGVYFYRARYYSPTLQRFISEDPLEFGGEDINLYRYAADSPVRFIDPFGLDVTVTLWPGAGGFGHVGVGVNTNDTQGFYPSTQSACLLFGCNVPGDLRNDQAQHPGVTPDTFVLHTTPDQDQAMQRVINQRDSSHGNYNMYGRNCARFVEDVLRAGGQNPLDRTYPHDLARDLRRRFQ